VEDIIRVIFEVLGDDWEFMKTCWDLGNEALAELIDIIYLTYLLKTNP
jgi:hypothetical protein